MKDWKNILLAPDDSIQQALRVIDAAGSQLALVADAEGRLLGVVTDGNVRRGLLAGRTLEDPVRAIMHPTPVVAEPDMPADAVLALMREKDLSHLPVVDEGGFLVACWSRKSLLAETLLDAPVVLMAGGLGSRLGELTKNCPKPLLQIGGKPLLEVILHNFVDCGFRNFFISVNYLAEMIERHFDDGSRFGVSIRYLREKKRLGTAGPLSLLPAGLKQPVTVMNGDILTRLNPRLLLEAHTTSGAAATMVVRQHELQVPYGVVRCSPEGLLTGIEEKPTLPIPISAGVNVFSAEALALIPKDAFFDVPDLFKTLLAQGKKVQAHVTDDYWLDIGREADYHQAGDDFARLFV